MIHSSKYLFQPIESAEYLRDESRSIGCADGISFPRTEADIVSVLTWASQQNTPVTVQGSRTGLTGGSVPYGGHILNLSRMNRIIGFSASASTLIVEPGVLLSEVRKYLEHHPDPNSGQLLFFPPDPTEPSASIGGMTACNSSGAKSYAYGATRMSIEAIRAVLSSGDLLTLRRGQQFADGLHFTIKTEAGHSRSGTLPDGEMPHCKNAAGFYFHRGMDLIDLLIGSDGTLAVISQLELKLRPRPASAWGILCFLPSEDQAVSFAAALRKSTLHPAAIEFFDGNALDLLRLRKDLPASLQSIRPIPACSRAAIYVELHLSNNHSGTIFHPEILARLKLLSSLLQENDADPRLTWVASDGSRLADLLSFRHAIPERVNQLIDERKKHEKSLTKLASDMSVPEEFFDSVFEMYRASLNRSGLQSAIWGHIGDHHLHVNILPRNRAEYQRGKDLFLSWANVVAHDFRGSVSAEHGIGKLKRDFLAIQYEASVISQMQELKRVFDPKYLLSPGNLFPPL